MQFIITTSTAILYSRVCKRSRKRSGAGRKPTWAERSGERGSKNQVEREREIVGTGT